MKLSDFPEHVQKRIRQDNPAVFNPVVAGSHKITESINGSGSEDSRVEAPEQCFQISLVQYRRRLLDSHDNLAFSLKPTVDAITRILGFTSDSSPRLHWEYGQMKTSGEEGVMVKIEAKTKL